MEKLKYSDCEISGLENLEEVLKLNKEGKHVIFAPNHVSPNSKIRQNLALAEDFPKLRDLLKQYGLDSRVVFRGDGDIEVGKSKVMEMIYDVHRKIFSTLGRAYTKGIPLAINAKDPQLAMSRNISSIKEILKTMKSNNLTIYPYGNWYKARQQKYAESLEDKGFVPMSDYSNWRNSLKSGFVRIAKQTNSPIMPIYVDNTDGVWRFSFGKLINVEKKQKNEVIADQYLQQMRLASSKEMTDHQEKNSG